MLPSDYFTTNTITYQLDWGVFVLVWILFIFASREISVFLTKKVLHLVGLNAETNLTKYKKIQFMALALVTIVTTAMAVLAVLARLGIDTKPLLTSVTIISALLALAIQTVIKDVVAGVMISSDGHFVIGDEVKIGTHEGVVKSIRLRHVILSAKGNKEIFIPNSEVRDVEVKKKSK